MLTSLMEIRSTLIRYGLNMYDYFYTGGNSSTWWGGYPLFNMSNVAYGPATISSDQ